MQFICDFLCQKEWFCFFTAIKETSQNGAKESIIFLQISTKYLLWILEAPFYNLKKAVQFVFPFAPVFLLKFKFNTNHVIPLVSSPITIFHGTHDKTTSYEAAKTRLRLNISSKNAFIPIAGGTHQNIRTFPSYKQKLTILLER